MGNTITSVPNRKYITVHDIKTEGVMEVSIDPSTLSLTFRTCSEFGRVYATKRDWEELKRFVDEEFANVE